MQLGKKRISDEIEYALGIEVYGILDEVTARNNHLQGPMRVATQLKSNIWVRKY